MVEDNGLLKRPYSAFTVIMIMIIITDNPNITLIYNNSIYFTIVPE